MSKVIGSYPVVKKSFRHDVTKLFIRTAGDEKRGYRVIVAEGEFGTAIITETFETESEQLERANELVATQYLPVCEWAEYFNLLEWFKTDSVSYAYQYKGKDVLGRQINPGDMIYRRNKMNLLVD